tara:strand:+ start:43 stop:1410 length:1368 start_codon:yes stop_codon:yes gene_type:complete
MGKNHFHIGGLHSHDRERANIPGMYEGWLEDILGISREEGSTYSDRGITYHDIPTQTDWGGYDPEGLEGRGRHILSNFERNKMLDDHIDYLMKNPVQQNYAKYQGYQDPSENYGQRINMGDYYDYNPQAHQNIWRMHGEGDDFWGNDWDKLYGAERYVPASVPIPHHDRPAGYQDLQPDWAYINALENFKEYGGDINIMNTADAYQDINPTTIDSQGNVIKHPLANVGGKNVGQELSSVAGWYWPWDRSITLNPANVVKKYPSAPMGPDSEWEFLGPNEQNIRTPYFEELDKWNLARVLPHEAYHLQEDLDYYSGWDVPNPGSYLEGDYRGSYTDTERHPMMHAKDRLLFDWGNNLKSKTLSKTQFQNLKADHARSMNESLNRPYWGDDKQMHKDWSNLDRGFSGSGRSRENIPGMWQDPSTVSQPNITNRSTNVSAKPRPSPHFNSGGIVSLVI